MHSRPWRILLLGWLVALCFTAPAAAEGRLDRAQAPAQDTACPVTVDPNLWQRSWTDQERRLWTALCLGRDVDLSAVSRSRPGDAPASPTDSCDIGSDKILDEQLPINEQYLITKLFFDYLVGEHGLVDVVSGQNIRIRCAIFEGNVDFSQFNVLRDLEIDQVIFLNSFSIGGLDLRGNLSFSHVDVHRNLHATGINIKGNAHLENFYALWFDFDDSVFSGDLYISGDNFDEDDDAICSEHDGFEIIGYISMEDSVIEGDFSLSHLNVFSFRAPDTRFFGHAETRCISFQEIDIQGAEVSGDLSIRSYCFLGQRLNAEDARINGDLSFSVNIQEQTSLILDFVDAEINGHLEIDFSHFPDDDCESQFVDSRNSDESAEENSNEENTPPLSKILRIEDNTDFTKNRQEYQPENCPLNNETVKITELRLRGASIAGDLHTLGNPDHTRFSISGHRLAVLGSIFLNECTSFDEIELPRANIGGSLNIAGGVFYEILNLTDAVAAGDLVLSEDPDQAIFHIQWCSTDDDANYVGTQLQDLDACWGRLDRNGISEDQLDSRLNLVGFRYGRLGSETANLPAETLLALLRLQDPSNEIHNPQPYSQLASALLDLGQFEKADYVMIAANDDRRTADNTGWWPKTYLSITGITIAYGYKIWLAIIWFAGFVFIGFTIACYSERNFFGFSKYQRFIFCVDHMIPYIQFDDENKNMKIYGFPRYYFIFTQIAGPILLSLFIAGWSGLK